ncbi:MAG: carboxylesterase/lipase family protein [Deltaproteobacteria bacterium]|nr:carboxylesterase/lipase family protein [Deltaproteobacteria bacterium]
MKGDSMKKSTGIKIVLMGIGFVFFLVSFAAADMSVVVKTQYGKIMGTKEPDKSGFSWLGVPFAKPPVGHLRWQPPEEPDNWNGVLKTQKYGNACTQVGGMFGPIPEGGDYSEIWETFFRPVGSEDCLYLNVWRPATSEENLPVILFIYGGTNVVGTAADNVYVGRNLANNANAVVVTTNYRVGHLGWFSHPALNTGDALRDSGNFGLLDLIQSLKFVKNNIANFGGDPDNVTIMGQSAGASNVFALIASPLAAGLFHKAIPLSGAVSSTSPTAAVNKANAVINALLIADGLATDKASADAYRTAQTNVWIKNYLMSKTGADFMRIQTNLTGGKWGTGVRVPEPGSTTALLWNAAPLVADGTVLPATIPLTNVIKSGNFNKVPLLVGHTAEEGKLFAGPFKVDDFTRFRWMVGSYLGTAPDNLKLEDLIDGTILNPLTVESYNQYTSPSTAFFVNAGISAMTSFYPQVPLYAYNFKWNKEPEPWDVVYGAWHSEDLPFIFGNFTLNLDCFGWSKANEPGRLALSNAMQKSIAAFIRTGDPNNSTLGEAWDPWTPTSPHKMGFDATYDDAAISQE